MRREAIVQVRNVNRARPRGVTRGRGDRLSERGGGLSARAFAAKLQRIGKKIMVNGVFLQDCYPKGCDTSVGRLADGFVAEQRAAVPVTTATGVGVMAKDAAPDMRLDDLSDAEIERIEAMVFCVGGPPCALSTAHLARASLQRGPAVGAPPAMAGAHG